MPVGRDTFALEYLHWDPMKLHLCCTRILPELRLTTLTRNSLLALLSQHAFCHMSFATVRIVGNFSQLHASLMEMDLLAMC